MSLLSAEKLDNVLLAEWAKVMGPFYEREKRWLGTFFNPPGEALSAVEILGKASALEEDVYLAPFRVRDELVKTYSWAVPTEEALDTIAEYSPHGVVEIGAGTGYWARLLRDHGVDIIAYDRAPYKNGQASAAWSEVLRGSSASAKNHPERSLFLCWPPYATTMAVRTLGFYAGDTVLYIGESKGGATANDGFHDRLAREWDELTYVSLPQWPGIRDGLYVYRRRQS